MARYLVTGATGFLGSHLVEILSKAGHEIVALCRRPEKELEAKPGVRVVLGDILDEKSVEKAAAGCDGLFHLAGKVSRRREDASRLYDIHVNGTEHALRGAYAAGVRRVVHMSTSGTVAISEEKDVIATEESETPIALIQRWPYYRSKLFAEKKALELGEELSGLEVVVLNPTLLLGPGDRRQSSTEDVSRFLEGKVPAVPPGGLSFVDVRDVAKACVLAFEKGQPGRRYLLGAINLTLGEFFDRLARLSGMPAPLVRLPAIKGMDKAASKLAERAMQVVPGGRIPDPISLEMAHHYWYLDASRAEQELGFVARDPLDTLADTVEDLLSAGVSAQPEPLSESLGGGSLAFFDGLLSRIAAVRGGSGEG